MKFAWFKEDAMFIRVQKENSTAIKIMAIWNDSDLEPDNEENDGE